MNSRYLPLAFLVIVLSVWNCTCQKTVPAATSDAAVEDDGTPPDSRPDAGEDATAEEDADPDSGRPQGVRYDFCGQPFFKLPMDGAVEQSAYVRIWGEGIAYTKHFPGHGYYFDLQSCTEYPLNPEGNDQVGTISIHNGFIFFSDCRFCSSEPEDHGLDLFMFDIINWQELRITENPYSQSLAKYNGRYLVYLEDVGLDVMSPAKLMLWDMQTDQKRELAPAGSKPGYFDISDRYVTWSAYTTDPQSTGKDVFFYDLETHSATHIDYTYERYQYDVSISGPWMTWYSSDVWVTPPYHLYLYNVETDERIALAENDRTGCYGTVHQNLVAWTTGKYREDQDPGIRPADIEVYDIDTGISRRVTTRPSMLRQVQVFFPYLIIVDVLGQERNMDDYYVAHLVRLGITDAQGHVIAGEGVLEPPRQ